MARRLLSLRYAALGALSVVAAGLACQNAALAYWRSLPPALVPSLGDNDAVVRLQRDNQAAGLGRVDRDELARSARAVLRRQPLDAVAARSLGWATVDHDPAGAARLMALAERMSRRDAPNQFMLIESAVHANDVGAALTHYDRALTVHPEAASRLTPVLSQALSEPQIARGLARYAGRLWFKPFLASALAQGADPSAVVALLATASRQLAPTDTAWIAQPIIARLLQDARFADLRALIRALPPAMARPFHTFGFVPPGQFLDGSPLGWTLMNSASLDASVGNDGTLEMGIAPEARALVTQRITVLDPGKYILRQTVMPSANAPTPRLVWQLGCLTPSAATSIPLSPMTAVASPEGIQSYSLTLPASCAGQRWSLYAESGVAQERSRASLAHLSLEPA